MKKNIISILILALLIVNVVLTSVMMFTVTGTMKKTAKLIDGISTALSLEIGNDAAQADPSATQVADVPIEDIATYQIEDELTIPLAKGADGKSHFCLVSISLAMNTKNKDYKKFGSSISEKEDLIRGEIVSAISSYTIEEVESDTDALRKDILARIQKMYDSEFIYNVVFREINCQ